MPPPAKSPATPDAGDEENNSSEGKYWARRRRKVGDIGFGCHVRVAQGVVSVSIFGAGAFAEHPSPLNGESPSPLKPFLLCFGQF